MLNIFLIFIVITLLVRGISTLVFLLHTISWIEKNQFDSQKSNFSKKPKLTVLIPALHEQNRIVKTLKHFVKHFVSKGISIVVITTQREYDKPFYGLSTQKIVEQFIKRNKLEKNISCLNYPGKNGIMAHQLNYALSKISDNNLFVAIYNADSCPHPKTIELFYQQLSEHPSAKIFQQSSAFIDNFDHLNIFLKTLAILQTRWTFAHEYARLLRQSISRSTFLKKYANAHVVGHGLIIQIKTLKEVGGFPTENVTEDLFLGYLLRSKGYSIYPLPLLELSESPSTIRSSWKQKYVWFWGPMKYLSYFRYVLKNAKDLNIKNLCVPLILTFQGLVGAVAWLLSALIVSICLIAPLLTTNIVLISFSYLAVFIYGPLQYFIVYECLPTLYELGGKTDRRPNLLEGVWISLLSMPAILFNSIPPYFSILAEIRHQITGEDIYKPKTE